MKATILKRLAFGLIIVAAIGTTVGVKALNNPAPVAKHSALTAAVQPQPKSSSPVQTVAVQGDDSAVLAAPAATPTASPTPVVAPPTPKTTDELKAEAAQRITSDGNNEEQVECFDRIIQQRYSWNVSETEMLHRIDTIEQTYISFCSGWSVIKNYPLSQNPPAFRD